MIPVLIEGPALEPVTLAEAKLWLRLDGPDEDDLVMALIVAARLMVEAEIGQVLIGQNWRLVGDRWPEGGLIPVRIGRILAVTGGRVFPSEGPAVPIAADRFTVFPHADPPGILPLETPNPGRVASGIEIDLRLGFGETASAVPETIRLAIRRLVMLWYENRGDAGDVEAGLPPAIRALLKPFRRFRLGSAR
ncbi:MAG: hypothetical protein LDL25_06355 [Hyphomicrobiales bacterium]|nr:hypothetical protein [Hyphomicrobiales bacterium]MCA1999394.1 hypothetical protein [Hyphomicrobiales bacterium]